MFLSLFSQTILLSSLILGFAIVMYPLFIYCAEVYWYFYEVELIKVNQILSA